MSQQGGGIIPVPLTPPPPKIKCTPTPIPIRTRLPAPRVPLQPVRQRLGAVAALEGLCGAAWGGDTGVSTAPSPRGGHGATGGGLTRLPAAVARLVQRLAGAAPVQALGAVAGQARGVCGHRGVTRGHRDMGWGHRDVGWGRRDIGWG